MLRLSSLVLLALVGLLVSCGGGSRPAEPEPDPPFLPPPSPDLRLDTDAPGAELSVFPEICGAGKNVYVTWYDRRAGNTDVYFTRSLDGGASWQAPDTRLDTDDPGAAGSNIPQICSDGDRVCVAWSDQRGSLSQIRVNRSLDAGATWLADDVRVDREDPQEGSSWNVEICCHDTDVYAVWQDARNGLPDVYFSRSTDGGETWLDEDVRLDTDVAGAATSEFPQIACCGDAVYVVWQDDRDGEYDVRFRRSLDGGRTWSEGDVRLDTDPAGDDASLAPRLCCDGDRVYVVWSDHRSGERDVHANASADKGGTFFDTDRRVDTSPPGDSASLVPEISCEGSAAYVVWEDFRSGFADIYVSRSEDGGASWLLSDVRIDTDPPGTAASFLPRIAATGSARLSVVWYDNREGAFDVLLSVSPDGGTTWSEKETRLDTDEEGAANSMAPALVVAGSEARVVWYDQRHGPGDIYFNRAAP